ncbi:MAG: glycosyltransferase family 39 protein [Anaerolineae bacterium]|nr:glycosyltransferase family 39 protein [Anaerolineae bacterium]
MILNLFFGLLLWILATGVGRRLCRWLRLDIKFGALGVVVWAALGAGVLGYLVFALGSLGVVSRGAAYGLILGLLILLWRDLWRCCGEARDWLRSGWKEFAGRRLRLVLLGLTLVHLALNLVAALAPPSAGDALRYHLNAPQAYIYQGRVSFIPDAQWNYPFTVEMIYMLGMLLYSDVVPAVFTCFGGVLVALGIYGMGRRLWGQTAGMWAAMLFYEMPWVTQISADAKNDLVFVLFGVGVMTALLAYRSARSGWRWLLVAGTLLGFAGGTRTNGLFFMISVLIAFAAATFLFSSGRARWLQVSHVLFLGVLAAFVAAPWYVRNWVAAGDPLWPMGYTWFGGRFMDQHFSDMWRVWGASAWATAGGVGARIARFLLGPWNLTMSMITHSDPRPSISAIPLAFLPGLFLAARRQLSRARYWMVLASVTCMLYYVCWFCSTRANRYLLILLPFVIVGAAWVVVQAWDFPGWLRRVYRLAIVVSSSVYLAIGLLFAGKFVPVVAGFQDRDSFLADNTTLFQAFQVANTMLPGGRRVLVTWQNDYYLAQPKVNVAPVRQGFAITYDHYRSADSFIDRVCELGVSHILVDSGLVDQIAARLRAAGIQDDLAGHVFGALVDEGRLRVVYDQPDIYTGSRMFGIHSPSRAVIYEVRCDASSDQGS